MDLLIRNIGELFQVTECIRPVRGAAMDTVASVTKAFLLIRDGKIADLGKDEAAPDVNVPVIDAEGGMVLPALVDCHTHLVFPASREEEFVMKIRGMDYASIARMGGGILNSARRLREIGRAHV